MCEQKKRKEKKDVEKTNLLTALLRFTLFASVIRRIFLETKVHKKKNVYKVMYK